ncbi:MAG: hypothetical protein AAF799_40520 [Myxococcota bacterium]
MRLVALLALPVLVALTGIMHGRVDERRAQLPAEQDLTVLPPPRYLELGSLSYREALADLVWVRALIFAGESLGQTDTSLVERYVVGITTLAPRFHRPYLWGGITAIYGGAGSIDRPAVERASAIYRSGLEQFPESHELLYAHGMLLTHQVSSTPGYTPEQREALAAEGVELIRRAAAHGADPLVRRYAATLITEGVTDQLAIQFLESQLVETEDEDHRRLLRRKLGALTSRESVARIERVREDFMREQKDAAPYLPDSVWAVIRSDPSPLSGPERSDDPSP